MTKMLIEVELVPVMVSVIAEPGDKLMVLNGVCIGVDTSKGAATPPRRIAHEAAPKPNRKSSRKTRKPRPRSMKPDSVAGKMRACILKNATHEPQTRGELLAGGKWLDKDMTMFNHAATILIRDGFLINPTRGTYALPNGIWTKADVVTDAVPDESEDKARVLSFDDLKSMGIAKTKHQVLVMMSEGQFPKSFKMGSQISWNSHEVEKWLEHQR